MGEAADAMLNGECCQSCGEWFFDENDEIESCGYPRVCAGCEKEDDYED